MTNTNLSKNIFYFFLSLNMETEEQIQSKCFKWHWNTFPEHRRKLFHVPNGGSRHKAEAAIFKALGVVSGVSDFIYLLDGYYFCIELKTQTGKQSENQKKFSKAVGDEYYFIVRSLEDFQVLIKDIHQVYYNWKLN